jgi:hypothetical protein
MQAPQNETRLQRTPPFPYPSAYLTGNDPPNATLPGIDYAPSTKQFNEPSKVGYRGERTPVNSFCHLPNDGKYLFAASFYLCSCIATAVWMLFSGPKPVPRQDTRITNAIISVLSKISLTLALWIVTVWLHAQWARVLTSGRRVKLQGLLVACGEAGSLTRVRYLHVMPTLGVRFTALVGVAVTICMMLTSAGFKYVVIPSTAVQSYLGPDFAAICNYSLVSASGGYFCTGAANAVTVKDEWNYLDLVNSGAGGNVVLSGNTTSGKLSANVTLTSSPANLRLPQNPAPPWAAIDVSCSAVSLQLELVGDGLTSNNILTVDGRELDQLSIANMPSWSSQIQLYQQVNDSGPASSLCPWYMVLLARDLGDGTSNIEGLAGSAVSHLGESFLDLHGYGPTLQGVLGAAAYCHFNGLTGGGWPNISWPARPTTNVVVGRGPQNGTVDVGTLFLNYGPSWQYTPASANSIPGGSISYIANFTTDALNYPDYIMTYMRNQWALMMYSNNFIGGFVTNTSYAVQTPPQLHIQATVVLLVPLVGLVICIGCAGACLWTMWRLGTWYEHVDIAPWWLMKAFGMVPGLGNSEVSKAEFSQWAGDTQCAYVVDQRSAGVGMLTVAA